VRLEGLGKLKDLIHLIESPACSLVPQPLFVMKDCDVSLMNSAGTVDKLIQTELLSGR
jgi:hypothetical protein